MTEVGRVTELEEIAALRRVHGKPGMTAGEFAEYLPGHLRPLYWRTKLDQYFREQGIDQDEGEATPLDVNRPQDRSERCTG